MPEKLRTKIKVRYLILTIAFLGLTIIPHSNVRAESCPDIKVVFARGSGAERWTNDSYLDFKATIESKLASTSLSYEFEDLDYPAISVGIDNLSAAAGALFGSGEAYAFGDSINVGVSKLKSIVNNAACKNTKYVLGGYSQGAMVVSKALGGLNSEKIIYAATFGDPKIYLPEGAGLMPAACRGQNLSDYRMYVPDCQAYKGLLGAYIPYEPEDFVGKLGTWCNKNDIFCSSHFSITDHVSYVENNLYEDAAWVIFDKITAHFGIENNLTSPHDTAFLIDSTGSMASMIERYKAEALRLATETLAAGGRVALYDYRDLSDPYEPVEHCNFENCTLETFTDELSRIMAKGGGDQAESLLSASFNVMQALTWQRGATKSLVVLTDADFLSPDRDGVTLAEVVRLSKTIDPVNFYIITNPGFADYYYELADSTDGLVVTNFDELHLLTEYIMERYDSLPRVEETDEVVVKPTLEIIETTQTNNAEAVVRFETNGERTVVILNDMILGITEGQEFKITDLNLETENVITLVPVKGDVRGDAISVSLQLEGCGGLTGEDVLIPKTPNTGRR